MPAGAKAGLMREPPDLGEGTIGAALRAGFGLHEPVLEFLPLGNDAASWAYRVRDGATYFLKVRACADAGVGAAVPSSLHRCGVPHVLAPLVSGGGAPFIAVDGFTLALYPMLDASTGVEAGLSPEQWRELGATIKQVHASPLGPELTRVVGREAFRPSRRNGT
jgi:spectinomycin phosphotransferase